MPLALRRLFDSACSISTVHVRRAKHKEVRGARGASGGEDGEGEEAERHESSSIRGKKKKSVQSPESLISRKANLPYILLTAKSNMV